MIWRAVPIEFPPARELADRHYSRQTIGAKGILAPGRRFLAWHDVGLDGAAAWGGRPEPRPGRSASLAELAISERVVDSHLRSDRRGDRIHIRAMARALWRAPGGPPRDRDRPGGDRAPASSAKPAGSLLRGRGLDGRPDHARGTRTERKMGVPRADFCVGVRVTSADFLFHVSLTVARAAERRILRLKMNNTTKRTAKAARHLAKALLKIKEEDKELALWLEQDLADSIQRFREIQSGIAVPLKR